MTVLDLGNNVVVNQQFVPASYTADSNGTGVDTTGYAYALVVVSAGVFGHATDGVVFTLQQSSDDGSSDAYTDCVKIGTSDAAAFTIITTGNDNQTYIAAVDLSHTKAYLRVESVESSATAGSCLYGVNIILMPYYTGLATAPSFDV